MKKKYRFTKLLFSSIINLIIIRKQGRNMKKIKLVLIGILIFSLTGCFKKDDFEDVQIYSTVYPIEYIINYLYGDHSTINSIYPNGVDTQKYELNNKQIKDYSKTNLYVFNGTNDKETNYISSMFQYNRYLKIIDAAQTMEYTYNESELWIDPSNFLMMALNIKNGILEYTTNHYLKNEIEENYNKLKIEISKVDANLKLLSENASKKTIIVDNSAWKFLEKYDFEVISLEENDELNDKTVANAINLIKTGQVSYIFTTNANQLNDTITKILNDNKVDILELHSIYNLTDEQRSNKEDYLSLLNDNIELLKNEVYD